MSFLGIGLLFYSFTQKTNDIYSPDKGNGSWIRTRTVYKYNSTFKDSARVYYIELDSVNNILKSEGHIFFDFPLLSSANFEWAVANAYNGDTVCINYHTANLCKVGALECAAFVMKFGSDKRPEEIKRYGCHFVDKKAVFDDVYLDKAVFSYINNGKTVIMNVFDKHEKISERVIRTYDAEGRTLITQWEVPGDGFYYKVFYSSYYK